MSGKCILSAGILLAALFALPGHAAPAPARAEISALQLSTPAGRTRAVFLLDRSADYKLFQLSHPDRVVLDVHDSRLAGNFRAPAGAGLVKDVRTGARPDDGVRVVFDMDTGVRPKSFLLPPTPDSPGYRLVLEMTPDSAVHVVQAPELAQLPDGGRKVVVVIDPGHGGRDTGAIGYDGIEEKNITLAVGKDLARLIDAQRGMKAVLTRTGDYYVTLDQRREIARNAKADMFISIHANACPDDCDTRGGSVWILSTKGASSTAAKLLAQSENDSFKLVGGVNLHDQQSSLASVLLSLSQGVTMDASRRAASDVLQSIGRIEPLYKSHVEHANFVVLRAPDVPSMLIETAFVTDKQDALRLINPVFQEKLAHSILGGVKSYFLNTPPPGTWFAYQAAKRMRTADAARQQAPWHGPGARALDILDGGAKN
ncbi:MAG: N-acetylmuramoyl-L-alanine amidase [Proteobacteria bacterium]|nr:N-acetylmuramoyl-L-alanine amidase [Pseudomonadota bacterium]